MRFALTQDQSLIRQAARDMLVKACPVGRVREGWGRQEGWDESLWADVAGLGAFGIHLPEEVGGLGLGAVELVLVLEETGAVALPEPVVEAVVAAKLLATIDDREAAARLLGPLVAGESLVTVAMGSDFVVSAAEAAAVLALHQGDLYLVEPGKASLARQESVDGTRRLYEMGWATEDARVLQVAADGVWEGARLLGTLGVCAQLLGLSRQMLDMSVAYASERRQFGKPIGSFQAVQHRLADALIKLDFARPHVWRAAFGLDRRDPEAGLHISMAKVYSCEAAMEVAKAALQVHGAMGYSTEMDLHLYMKRAWALSAAWGNAAHHQEVVAQGLLGV